MRDDAVHEKVPKKDEYEHRMELHAIGERARSDASAVAKKARQLEHDEERLGNGALYGKRQDVLETGNVGKVVRGSVKQPEFLRATHEGVSGE
jgi:hypothetical protein